MSSKPPILFDYRPAQRLRQLQSLSTREAGRLVDWVMEGVPGGVWPHGMPCSAAPHVVVLGVGPGDSPDRKHMHTCDEDRRPWVDKPSSGFWYKDKKHYWDKVRSVCLALITRDAPGFSERECITLSANLNLSERAAGQAANAEIQPELVQWVARLLRFKFQARYLVCFGVKEMLRDNQMVWSGANGLTIDWRRYSHKESFRKNYFRHWRLERDRQPPLDVLMWPNHPGKPPFSGCDATHPTWQASLHQARRLVSA